MWKQKTGRKTDKLNPSMSDTLVRFLAYVGLRIGKTAALKVSNMDFEKLRVNILRIWTEDDKSKPALGSAKTWEHKRVAIPLFLVVPPPPQKARFRATTQSLRFPAQTRRTHKHKELV